MTAITVTNESTLSCDTSAIEAMLHHHMGRTNVSSGSELGVLLVDEPQMSQLHEEWMGEPGPTDVLSFPMDEMRSGSSAANPSLGTLGDIVVCLPVADRQAHERGRSLDEEVQFLITHGYLHLLGHDHADAQEQEAMFALQDSLLNQWQRHDGGRRNGE